MAASRLILHCRRVGSTIRNQWARVVDEVVESTPQNKASIKTTLRPCRMRLIFHYISAYAPAFHT